MATAIHIQNILQLLAKSFHFLADFLLLLLMWSIDCNESYYFLRDDYIFFMMMGRLKPIGWWIGAATAFARLNARLSVYIRPFSKFLRLIRRRHTSNEPFFWNFFASCDVLLPVFTFKRGVYIRLIGRHKRQIGYFVLKILL